MEEGIAGQYDNPSRLQARRQVIRWFARSRNWPRIDSVMGAAHISASDVEAYAVCSSLTDFLLTRGDRQTFLRCAADGAKSGWDGALERHYGLAGVSELQAAWQGWAETSP